MREAADPAEEDSYGSDECEPVAGRRGEAGAPLDNLDPGIPAQQRPNDGFARGQVPPQFMLPNMQPTFDKQVGQLRSDERTAKPAQLNQRQPRIASGQPRPPPQTHTNAREHQETVGRSAKVHGTGTKAVPAGGRVATRG